MSEVSTEPDKTLCCGSGERREGIQPVANSARPSDGVAASRRKTRPPAMTDMQWRLLQDVVSGEKRVCHERYTPLLTLCHKGLVQVTSRKYSQAILRPTDAGIALVKQYQGTTP